MNIWLMKSEPSVYSLSQLKRDKKTLWEGVRNYQARNFMTQSMKLNDWVLFYHSNEEPVGIAGLARVSRLAIPDPSQFDKKSDYYEPRATPAKPVWFCVEVSFVKSFPAILSLSEIRKTPQLQKMLLLQRGQRLSIQPVAPDDFAWICNHMGVDVDAKRERDLT